MGLIAFVILLVAVMYIMMTVFFQAPNPMELMKAVINQGIGMIMGGITKASMTLTTIG